MIGPIERMRRARAVRRQLEEQRDALYQLAYAWCQDPYLADDLVQQTAAKALQNAAQLRCEAHARAWLCRILSNCWHDHLRRGRETVDVATVVCIDHHTPEHEAEREAVVRRVRAAMRALSPEHRQVLSLVDLQGCSYAEVASILEIPVGTVMSRLCRARRALKAQLDREAARPAVRPPARIRRIQ